MSAPLRSTVAQRWQEMGADLIAEEDRLRRIRSLHSGPTMKDNERWLACTRRMAATQMLLVMWNQADSSSRQDAERAVERMREAVSARVLTGRYLGEVHDGLVKALERLTCMGEEVPTRLTA